MQEQEIIVKLTPSELARLNKDVNLKLTEKVNAKKYIQRLKIANKLSSALNNQFNHNQIKMLYFKNAKM